MHNDVPDRSRLDTAAPGRSHALKANLRRARVAGRSSIFYYCSFVYVIQLFRPRWQRP